jgi:hypothetical protein
MIAAAMEKMGRILRADGEAWTGQVWAFEVSPVPKSEEPGTDCCPETVAGAWSPVMRAGEER